MSKHKDESCHVPQAEIQRLGVQTMAMMKEHDPERYEGVTQCSYAIVSVLETEDEVKIGVLALINDETKLPGLTKGEEVSDDQKLEVMKALAKLDVTDIIIKMTYNKIHNTISEAADAAMALKGVCGIMDRLESKD